MNVESEVAQHHAETFGPTEAEYRIAEGVSYSQLKLLPDQPELFHGRFISKIWPLEPTAAMELGTIFHEAVLLGKELPIIPPEVLSKSGSRAGAPWAEWKDNHPGPCIKQREAEPLLAMIDSVWADKQAAAMLRADGRCELALFGKDLITGLPIKGRLDKLAVYGDSTIIVDLKTTNDPTPEAFAKQVWQQRYHRQADFYQNLANQHGHDVAGCVFIAVRNEPPFECVVYQCDSAMLEKGYEENRKALDDLARRLKADYWHGPTFGRITELSIPKWALSKGENQ
jgi:exodeoxyribonuclease VIII